MRLVRGMYYIIWWLFWPQMLTVRENILDSIILYLYQLSSMAVSSSCNDDIR